MCVSALTPLWYIYRYFHFTFNLLSMKWEFLFKIYTEEKKSVEVKHHIASFTSRSHKWIVISRSSSLNLFKFKSFLYIVSGLYDDDDGGLVGSLVGVVKFLKFFFLNRNFLIQMFFSCYNVQWRICGHWSWMKISSQSSVFILSLQS